MRVREKRMPMHCFQKQKRDASGCQFIVVQEYEPLVQGCELLMWWICSVRWNCQARAMLAQMSATRLQRQEKQAMEAQAKRDQQLARIQTVIWESEYGFWLASNNDTWDTASPINAY